MILVFLPIVGAWPLKAWVCYTCHYVNPEVEKYCIFNFIRSRSIQQQKIHEKERETEKNNRKNKHNKK